MFAATPVAIAALAISFSHKSPPPLAGVEQLRVICSDERGVADVVLSRDTWPDRPIACMTVAEISRYMQDIQAPPPALATPEADADRDAVFDMRQRINGDVADLYREIADIHAEFVTIHGQLRDHALRIIDLEG